ncbi:MAG: hypothetical protein Q4G68_06960 [Planctomycetia bacterium]|nr:hypothetical protein [Planctomycetia bacterium]
MTKTNFAVALGSCLLLLLTGCHDNPHGTVPVTVKVEYNGQPISEAVVVFRGDIPASGATNDNGIARLSSFQRNDGAVPGAYKVTIEKVMMDIQYAPEGGTIIKNETKFLIPAVYGNPETSELSAEVDAKGRNHFTFQLDDSRRNSQENHPHALKD